MQDAFYNFNSKLCLEFSDIRGIFQSFSGAIHLGPWSLFSTRKWRFGNASYFWLSLYLAGSKGLWDAILEDRLRSDGVNVVFVRPMGTWKHIRIRLKWNSQTDDLLVWLQYIDSRLLIPFVLSLRRGWLHNKFYTAESALWPCQIFTHLFVYVWEQTEDRYVTSEVDFGGAHNNDYVSALGAICYSVDWYVSDPIRRVCGAVTRGSCFLSSRGLNRFRPGWLDKLPPGRGPLPPSCFQTVTVFTAFDNTVTPGHKS